MRKKIDTVRKLLNSCGILLLQEILLTSDDSSFMNGIDENFTFLFVPSKLPDSNEERPFGGLAIMWRQSLNILVQTMSLQERFMIINLGFNDSSIVLVNVHLPFYDRNYESFIEYSQTLGEIEAFVNNKGASNLLSLGDFNTDPTRCQLWKLVEDFCDDWGLRVYS